jgi:hypothetical protein
MKQSGYQRLKKENEELKERLSLYDNGIVGVDLVENVIKVPKSFENIWKMCGKPDMEDLILDLCNEVPYVKITLISGKATIKANIPNYIWEFLLKIGDGSASKGIDHLLSLYHKDSKEK